MTRPRRAPDGITDIAGLRGQAKRVGNAYQVRLTEEARGKVVVGETTFLFQFVAPPPPAAAPAAPARGEGWASRSQIDWNLTIIAAFSFLLHFGVDWRDVLATGWTRSSTTTSRPAASST